ncbi:MAG TPA: amidophosphoribosyltransferase [Clostridia bacterium]|jgi:amidophosphoribosyltransferase
MVLDKVKEECGVFGFYDNDGFDVARMTYYGLYALQHRGQESCGIAVNDDGVITVHKGIGLVNEVFDSENIQELKGKMAVGHVLYSTSKFQREDCQPLVSRYIKGSLTIALNGNLTNAHELRAKLEQEGAIFQSSSNAEVIMHLAARARTKTHSIEEAMLKVLPQLEGAFSLIIMSPRKLIAIRDPKGFRPLCLGKIKNSYIIASETAALDVIRAEFLRDIEAGEMVIINQEGLNSIKYASEQPSHCVFEYIYFARPDSVIDGVSVYQARVQTGKLLAKAHPVEADIVVGVPDSGLSFAVGYAQESGIPYGEGLIKNRYTGRTFIKPTQDEREMSVSIKLNVLKNNIKGKRVILIDDSIVRGTTCANLIKLFRNAGATEIHMRVASPPFLWPCYFGTDIPSRKELIAVKYTLEEIRQKIGADSLGYLPLEDIKNIGLKQDQGYCDACFSGKYSIKKLPKNVPTPSKTQEEIIYDNRRRIIKDFKIIKAYS